jgi:pyruvate-formate lyase-activating enzyme
MTHAQSAPVYGFYGRLSSAFPSQVIVDSTEVCNLACIHCPHPTFKKSAHYAGRFLDLELHAKMIDEVRDHGQGATQYIRYTGQGEPMLHPHIFEMLADARRANTSVTLTTNGTLLTPARLEKLLDTGVNLIDISIDAFTPETYAAVRVNGKLEVTQANVLQLLAARDEMRGERPRVVVSYVEQPNNTHETKAFEAYWKEQGADYVVIRRLHSAAGAVAPAAQVIAMAGAQEPRRPCVYLWERLVLSSPGELVFCPVDWVHGAAFADYRTTTIRDAWQGEFLRRLREAHLANDFRDHAFCGNCPDWRVVRWPSEGRAYADMVVEFQQEGPGVDVVAAPRAVG